MLQAVSAVLIGGISLDSDSKSRPLRLGLQFVAVIYVCIQFVPDPVVDRDWKERTTNGVARRSQTAATVQSGFLPLIAITIRTSATTAATSATATRTHDPVRDP